MSQSVQPAVQPPIPIEQDILVATFTVEGEMAYRNDAWIGVLGKSGRPWQRLSDQEQGLAASLIKEAAAGSLVTNELFMIRLPNWDSPIPVLLNFVPTFLPKDGALEVQAVMITGEVLTEPTTWMSSQTQRHRLETLGRMTMGIAHDFNNLLSGILGHTELLKQRDSANGQTGGDEHVTTIERAALDGASLVKKIQQYIRHEKQTAFEPVRLNEIIEDSVTLTRPYWYNEPRRQGIAIETRLEFEETAPIMGAASELRDVFVNLILNAVQAMPRGGEIRFRTFEDAQHGIVAHVSDSGTGMTDRVRARIFEPLFTTKGKRGTGMGLAVCYGTIQEHDGDIEVETNLGFGTTFKMNFPPSVVDSQHIAVTESVHENNASNILIVDDESMVRSVLAKLLALKHHRVTQAASGSEGLLALENDEFDLVFTDQGMPEMSGRVFARHVRSRYPELPIVLLTGDTEAGMPDSDVNMVIAKPFKLDVLEHAIQSLSKVQMY